MSVKECLVIRMVFDNAADRDTWYTAFKQNMGPLRPTLPPFEEGEIKRFEMLGDETSEDIP